VRSSSSRRSWPGCGRQRMVGLVALEAVLDHLSTDEQMFQFGARQILELQEVLQCLCQALTPGTP